VENITVKQVESKLRQHESYSPGYGDELVASYQARSVGVEAAFFTPYLSRGVKLLDCGCGPGSISGGLAAAIAPGEFVGVDVDPGQVATAEANARKLGLTNASFRNASIYELPFPDETFDAAFIHAVLQHLQRPVDALREVKRVLRRGGVVGVRDDDQGSLILAPEGEHMGRVVELLKTIMRHSGGNPTVGRQHRGLLRRAGFEDIRATASTECDGEPAATTKRGDLAAALLQQMSDKAVAVGWATAAEMAQLAEASRAWGRDPDAYDAITWCEAVARRP
jgi:ubiquinone/menaquinone biosynthesis C-methylase UbiE